jgi:hypothetical protein
MDAPDLADILRRIIERTDGGPRACVGYYADGNPEWKAGFHELLRDARLAIDGRMDRGSPPGAYPVA